MRIGSAFNASFKRKQEKEYVWFAAASSIPLMTIGAERAARQILRACRRGEAELVITLPAKLAVMACAPAPEIFSDAMSAVQHFLPRAAGPKGDVAQPGRMAGSAWAASKLFEPMHAAAQRNNEL